MIDAHFLSLCTLLGTKERKHSFAAAIDTLISTQSQSASFSLSEEIFTRDEFRIIRELVKSYSDLKQLRKQLFEVPIFSAQISFIPTKQFSTKLISLLQTNISDPFFLEIIVNPGIMGGCVIEFKGMYNDRSLKRDITKWMKARPKQHGR